MCGLALAMLAMAEEPRKEGGWLIERDEQTGRQLYTMELTLSPQSEPRPALKYRLIADRFDMVDGNAAIYYLKALGFLEQDPARDRLREFHRRASERVRDEGKEWDEVTPRSWQTMSPQDLPLPEVKEYLSLTAFQPQFLREAARRPTMDLDRHIREVSDPVGYLLPEIQTMRELARTQSLRCRVAIAEGRTDDALAVLGQQYTMAWHLGDDEFLVSNLVGAAVAGMAWTDALYLVQRPETPNLYWAFASLPRPLIGIQQSLAYERQFLFEQLKVLREVDETPRPVGYWNDFLDRLIPQIGLLASELRLSDPERNPDEVRAQLMAYVTAAYPAARRYLIERWGMSSELVDQFPVVQTVALAGVRYYDIARDNYFKWTYLPYWQQVDESTMTRHVSGQPTEAEMAGWCTLPADALLPAVLSARTATARIQQQVALLQTVEAIRMHASAHDRQLPKSLEELPYPAPLEPFSNKPLNYQYEGDHAVLTGHQVPGLQYRLVLRLAQPIK